MEISRTSPSVKKILMTADTLGGVWTYALELSRALADWNVEIYLATMGRNLSEDQRKDAAKIENLHIIESDYKLEWMENPWRDVQRAGRWLKDLEKEIKPHIVHLNNYVHGAETWDSPVLITAHSDVYSWFAYVKNQRPDKSWLTYHQQVEKGLNGVDHIVAITRAVDKDLQAQFYYSTPTTVIHNGLNAEGFKKRKKESFALSVGRIWDDAKNFSLLNEAAKYTAFPVAVAGENRHPVHGNRAALENLHFTGKLGRSLLRQYMGRAAVYCLPATYEPFGYTPLEAAYCGCALLLSDIESLHEVWQDAAVFFDPENPEDLAEKLDTLLADKHLQQELAFRSQQRAQHFTAYKMASDYMKLYQKLANHHFATKLMSAYAN